MALTAVQPLTVEAFLGTARVAELGEYVVAPWMTRNTRAGGRKRSVIGKLIDALEGGLDADEVRRRLKKLQTAKEKAEVELRTLAPRDVDSDAPDAAELLARIPDLTHALSQAAPDLKRQLFEAFGLQVTYDKTSRHIEISATISQQLADTLETAPEIVTEQLVPVRPGEQHEARVTAQMPSAGLHRRERPRAAA